MGRFKAKKMKQQTEDDLPNLNSSEVKDAAIKIQSAYRGFQTRSAVRRKVVKTSSDSSESEEGYDKKKRVSSDSSETESEDEIKKPPRPAVMRRPHKSKPLKTRRIPDSSATESQSEQGESLPDLDDSDVEDAALKIQSAFRGFQARRNVGTIKKSHKMGDVLHSAMVIQRSFRR